MAVRFDPRKFLEQQTLGREILEAHLASQPTRQHKLRVCNTVNTVRKRNADPDMRGGLIPRKSGAQECNRGKLGKI